MKNNVIVKIDSIFIRLGNWLSIIFFCVVVISFFEVVMRYVFDSPTTWVHETTTFIISLSLLYGGVACYADNKHIRMEFIKQIFSNKIQWYMELLVEIFMLIFILMLTYGAFCSARDAFISPFGTFKMQTSGTVLDTPFPALNKGFFLLTCVAMLILCMLHITRHILTKNEMAVRCEDDEQSLLKQGGNNA
ncbi:TRAP transporter small permease [Vibrio rhizosphaerae]|uniref:TRAP transporter small permease protein n=1 Tax=Vibrio rhizosphaerae TaxID=398736 RepID=A0ABU4IW59_9VIBR|nr:TRAP transporter small permease [Vibrio rhizosphaerae]MDW6092524.1 TRAP transporter small permease [Vibrio rhizosphaerae]